MVLLGLVQDNLNQYTEQRSGLVTLTLMSNTVTEGGFITSLVATLFCNLEEDALSVPSQE